MKAIILIARVFNWLNLMEMILRLSRVVFLLSTNNYKPSTIFTNIVTYLIFSIDEEPFINI